MEQGKRIKGTEFRIVEFIRIHVLTFYGHIKIIIIFHRLLAALQGFDLNYKIDLSDTRKGFPDLGEYYLQFVKKRGICHWYNVNNTRVHYILGDTHSHDHLIYYI